VLRSIWAVPSGIGAESRLVIGSSSTVWLDTTLERARRRIPPAMATLAEADGGVLLHARVERLDGMARVHAGPEWPFRIREPDELRAALRDHAAALATQAP
jgi:hypothetical protein